MSYVISYVVIYLALTKILGLCDFEINHNVGKNLITNQQLPESLQLNVPRRNMIWKSSHKSKIWQKKVKVRNKTILLWRKPHFITPIGKMFKSKINFCRVKNCAIHMKLVDVKNVTKYDAVIFSEFNNFSGSHPKLRLTRQKYIYLFVEPTTNYPITNEYNGVFNWVMSYRLTSDIKFPYITIYDKAGAFVGPKINMTWIKDMKDINPQLQQKLQSKTKLGAIFISFCKAKSNRLYVVKEMNNYLRKYNLNIDVYGRCGTKSCPKNNNNCDEMLERDYFFYLSFENSFAVDYVTEKLTRAVHTHTVPVVLGGADYSRFLPPGSYINACDRDPAELAETLVRVMSNWTRYYEYFRFNNHYDYFHSNHDKRFVCDLCEMLNDENLNRNHSRYKQFDQWYNYDINMKCQK